MKRRAALWLLVGWLLGVASGLLGVAVSGRTIVPREAALCQDALGRLQEAEAASARSAEFGTHSSTADDLRHLAAADVARYC